MRFPGFIGPSYQNGRSVNIDSQRCINLYAEKNEAGTGKEGEVAALLGTPGLTLKLTLAGGVCRGLWTASNGTLYAVGGNKLYSINSSFVATERGTLNTSSGTVSMADNGLQLVIVDGANGYSFTFGTNTFAQITDGDFLGANQVVFQDGYFIFNKPSSGQFYISGLNDVTFDALDFATSEGNPDNVVGIASLNRNLYVFNDITSEVFYNSGNADFPFERVQGGFIKVGCAARFSIATDDTSCFWIGNGDEGRGIIYRTESYQPQRISTHPVEEAIQGYSSISDAVGFCYQQEGHNFYVLNFPTANTTWVYDATTGLWHERAYNNAGTLERHRANYHAFAYGVHVVGDYANGKIYELSTSVYTDAGDYITRQRIAPHITSDLDRVIYKAFQLDLETGVGLDGTGQGTDPQVMLQFSDDGAHSWSNEKWTDMGQIGERKARAIWRRLGQSRDRVFKLTITDPVKVVLIGAKLDIEKAAS